MNVRQTLLGTAIALAATGNAMAGDAAPKGWYMSLGAGANWIEDGAIVQTYAGSTLGTGEVSFDRGYVISGAVGKDFGPWRTEFEVAYRDNRVDQICDTGGCEAFPGDIWEFSQMVNFLYDIPLGGRLEASVGAGIGGNLVVLPLDGLELDDYVFAGQLIAQGGYRLTDRWQLFLDYHYMIMEDPELAFPIPGAFNIEKTEHSVSLGLRFDLQRDAAPVAPPPPPPPPPAAPKQFIVFFGFDKANLTEEASRVVADAAAAAKQYGTAAITIVGHTDTSGSNEYNQKLSMRRSQAVKDGLAANGIKADSITTAGRGETELLVQTGDGVKEPQNRRATIDLN